MKPNIFQKIAFLVYILIILLICVYFVPYQNKNNYTFHSSIMSDGYGIMSYFRFIIYLLIPTVFIYFVNKYLDGMNSSESSIYKKKAKKELYVFFLFVSIIVGTVLFLFGKNEYSQIRETALKSEISTINIKLNEVEEELQKRPPLDLSAGNEILNGTAKKSLENISPYPKGYEPIKKDTVKQEFDEFGIAIKKTSFNLNEPNEIVEKKSDPSASIKKEDVFKEGKEIVTDKDRNLIVSELRNYAKEGATDDELREFKYAFVKAIVNKKRELNKENLELKLKGLNFYNEDNIKFNVVFAFLGSFILLYIIRPLFSMLKGMLKEVR